MIFLLLLGIFRKFPVQAKLLFSLYACCVYARGGRESLLFFTALENCLKFQNPIEYISQIPMFMGNLLVPKRPKLILKHGVNFPN